ncbi:MAG: hypothetical protein K6346_01880 [Halothiobacillaceae bacterium]
MSLIPRLIKGDRLIVQGADAFGEGLRRSRTGTFAQVQAEIKHGRALPLQLGHQQGGAGFGMVENRSWLKLLRTA